MNTNDILNNLKNGTVIYGRISIILTSIIITLLYFSFFRNSKLLGIVLLSILWIFAISTFVSRKAAILSAIIHLGTPL